jgi:GntR family transcriptional repressor for pyruvate dehydrogenase complex
LKLIDKVQEKIRVMIMDKKYDYGYMFNEGELSERFKVSRTTVREAVRSLEMRGYVKRIHGKGIQVVNNGEKVFARSLTDMFERGQWSNVDLVEVRNAIEVAAVSLLIPRITDKEIRELELLVEAMENNIDKTDDYYNKDFSFHLNLVKATKNQILSAIVSAYTPLLFKQIMLARSIPYNEENKYHFHRNIIEGVKEKNIEKTQEAMRTHLVSTRKNFMYVKPTKKEITGRKDEN